MTVLKNIAKDRILQITVLITVVSLFFARPRFEDINFHTLYSVAAMLTIIQIYAYLHVLDVLAYKLTSIADNTRKLNMLFTLLAVISGMFLGNDITALTLIPLYLNIAKKYELPQILPVRFCSRRLIYRPGQAIPLLHGASRKNSKITI